jgi:hypothetical protein
MTEDAHRADSNAMRVYARSRIGLKIARASYRYLWQAI